MTKLAGSIEVSGRFARSANLERDLARPEPLEGYVLTARGLDVVERIAAAAAQGTAGGAWSLTGPYGSGKSSLALLLDAVFGGRSKLRSAALGLVDGASSDAGDLIRRAHRRHGTLKSGFNRALVTAEREPLTRTVARALHTASIRDGSKLAPPPPQNQLLDDSKLTGARRAAGAGDEPDHASLAPSAVVEAACRAARVAPLLLIIDEFGKNLEAVRDGGDADPYLLQQLAEAGQGSGLPIFVVTLQHLSFEDCLAGADDGRRREWAKVQGRFEDVAFVDSHEQTRSLVGTVFEVVDQKLQGRIDRWAKTHARQMRALGIAELAAPAVIASCYPLHPLSALVLPELCSRYGQHERTLFSFLAGSHRDGVRAFLETTNLPARGTLPSLGLDTVYDYFVASGALSIASARQSSRWTEIATRLRDSHGLTGPQERTAKAVALLNLVSTTGTIRASQPLLALTGKGAEGALAQLESAGVVTYRDFADEYRIWHGSDIDIGLLLDTARLRAQGEPLCEIVSGIDQPAAVVAARHSAEHDVLRVFSRRYVSGGEQVTAPEAASPFDGEVLLVVDPSGRRPSLSRSAAGVKPVVAAVPRDVSAVDAAAREAAAVAAVLDDPAVAGDRVARRELGERLAQTRAALDYALADAFGSEACRWILLGPDDLLRNHAAGNVDDDAGDLRDASDLHDAGGDVDDAGDFSAGDVSEASAASGDGDDGGHDGDSLIELPAGRGSAPVSAAADIAYPFTPAVGNEMLNRSKLTSQGSKSRRLLLEAMIQRGHADGPGSADAADAADATGPVGSADLGFEGYGPETAMYRSFLLRTGLHSAEHHDSRRVDQRTDRRAADGSADRRADSREKDGRHDSHRDADRCAADRRGVEMAFGAPSDATLRPAWDVLVGEFKRSRDRRISLSEVNAALMSPLIGMKAEVVPVFVTAGLLAFRDEVAIYEHGTFKPLLSPELSERMVRNPVHFDVKHFANTSGGRLMVVKALTQRLGLVARGAGRRRRQRVGNVLAVVGALVSRISRLDNYSRRTRSLGAEALAVREALTVAVEPDELLFVALPEALGFDPVAVDDEEYGAAGDLAGAVAAALEELESCLHRMLSELLQLLLDACATGSRTAVVGEAAALGDEVLDPAVRAFVLALANESAASDTDWIAAVATVVACKAPAEWSDEDRARFCRDLPERLAAFHRLVALHAERRAHGGGPFEALRVTVTRSDGSEYIRLVSIDSRCRQESEAVLDGVLADLAEIAGSPQRAQQSLMALLSERLLAGHGSSQAGERLPGERLLTERGSGEEEKTPEPAVPAVPSVFSRTGRSGTAVG